MKLYFLFRLVSLVVSASKISVKEGDSFSLPCVMEETVWRHNNRRILYVPGAGGEIFKSPNLTLEVAENGTHLMIQNAKLGEAGVRI